MMLFGRRGSGVFNWVLGFWFLVDGVRSYGAGHFLLFWDLRLIIKTRANNLGEKCAAPRAVNNIAILVRLSC